MFGNRIEGWGSSDSDDDLPGTGMARDTSVNTLNHRQKVGLSNVLTNIGDVEIGVAIPTALRRRIRVLRQPPAFSPRLRGIWERELELRDMLWL